MASYKELFSLHNNSNLKNRVRIAVLVAAETIHNEDPTTTNHAERLIWAKAALQNPAGVADDMFWAVLAANKDATLANITGATDAAVQTAVDNAVDLFATN